MDGRDIGTVVFPKARLKIFLVASPEVRARRRFQETQLRYPENSPPYEEILQDIIIRDGQDSSREISPLKRADDAILVDTSTLSIEAMITLIESLLSKVAL
jgi:cytidylate kinase